MPFQKGHKINVGSKTNGRKTKAEEFRILLAKKTEEITNDIISGRAKNITNAVLKSIEESGVIKKDVMKDIVLPIQLKGMVEKRELNGNIKIGDIIE